MENHAPVIVREATDLERASFYRKVYSHLALAILAFIVVETLFIKFIPESVISFMLGGKGIWLLILGLFWLGSTLSNRLVFNPSREKQYLGLGVYVIIEALIFLPMIYIALILSEDVNLIMEAALLTLFMFGGLTAAVFLTKTDFSFLRTFIVVGGFVALGIIVVGLLFGFELGLWFSAAMVILASASILYNTSQIKDQFSTDQYVGASLQLFASVMLLFWYILRILMSRRN
ncbi:Bax inhibitor-1 family protein [Flavobacterium sp.]|uniref:Bax inhibitor-1/YccA family protein n=1 Tax=Flavobacterium sp. TaxID=239 RepID=UPI0035271B04